MIKVNRYDIILPKTSNIQFPGIVNLSAISNIYRPRVDDGVYGNWTAKQSARTWVTEIEDGDWIGSLENPPFSSGKNNDVYYNETNNTLYRRESNEWVQTYRGPFKDFPEISIALADTNNNVIIYDLCGNEPVPWMIFTASVNSYIKNIQITDIHILGGCLVLSQVNNGIIIINFFTEDSWNYTTTGLWKHSKRGIVNRNDTTTGNWINSDSNINLESDVINKLHVTVSKNTNNNLQLFLPTIYAGTNNGCLQITPSNTLNYYKYTWDTTVPVNYISGQQTFSSQLHYDYLLGNGTGLVVIADDSLPETTANDFTITDRKYNDTTIPNIGIELDEFTVLLSISDNTHYIGYTDKLVILYEYTDSISNGMVSIITNSYATPYMIGDTDLCLDGSSLTDKSFFGNSTIVDLGSVVISSVNNGNFYYYTASGDDITVTVNSNGDFYGWELVSNVWYFRKTASEWVGITKDGTTLTIADGTSFTRLVHTATTTIQSQLDIINEHDQQLFSLNGNILLTGTSNEIAALAFDKLLNTVYVSTTTNISTYNNLFNIESYDESSQFLSVDNEILVKG